MRERMLNPIAALAVTSCIMLFGCAGSDTTDSSTTDTTMSETQTMEGDVAAEDAGMEAEAEINYDDMFETMGNTKQYDVVALANSNQNLSTFVSLLEKAEIEDVLKSGGPFTVFIPTNNAFNKLSKEQLNTLTDPKNKVQLVQVLQAHIIPSKVYAADFKDAQTIKTAEGNIINVLVEPNNNVTIGGARIVKPNVEVSNGVVHIVDNVVTASNADGGLIDR
ncbi:fasciclin domain-containing protein [Pontibacter sp. KCTC 32443]|uniref:fasciclin domain-containing protein n=1 Tax=Pontibacter TaxID=323449 RepID=UPI00164CDF77|nr:MULTISPECIES: fasciclin domain-containing protein [Pontibacter]MBC5775410.1 fasciclin domain-containing protein [Pontibacter sp. KCTC 32443]